MKHELPLLPYEMDALEPKMSRETLEYHYGKHLQTYINNLNSLIEGTKYENTSLENIVKTAEGGIFNNGAQTWNHTLFFLSLSPNPKPQPEGPLAQAIEREFGSFDAMKEQFTKSAIGLFGSGWTWLSKDSEGKLSIDNESNAGNPLREGLIPIMTCDVWEHAYYIDYRNRRPDFVTAFWDILDWNVIESRYQ